MRSIIHTDDPTDWLCNDCRITKRTVMKAGRSKAAKARKLGEFTTYRVFVIGHAWGGFKGTYSYTYDHNPTEQFIKARAGDFESLIDWQIMAHRRIVYSDGERTIVTKVKDWQLEDSVDFYCDANGC